MGATKDVLKLIQDENPNWLIHHGDLQYTENSRGFEEIINYYFPTQKFVGVLGNHDRKYGLENYLETLNNLCFSPDSKISDAKSTKQLDEDCVIQKETGNIWCDHELFTVVGVNIGMSADYEESQEFIISSFKKSNAQWKICTWHFP